MRTDQFNGRVSHRDTLVDDMSIYRPLDKGIANDIDVTDVTHRRMREPSTPMFLRSGAATSEPRNAADDPDGIARRIGDAQYRRRAEPNNVPLAATFKWIAGLPREVRPLALLQRFPRIANTLARAWTDPPAFRDYMFELLIDRRRGRQGFPPLVQRELLTLRAFFDQRHPHASSRRVNQEG